MIFDSLFDYTGQIEIETQTSLEESIQRLSHLVERNKSSWYLGPSNERLFKSYLSGYVSGDRFTLSRVRAFMRNYLYKPIFVGKFVHSDHGVVLKGKFSMSIFAKLAFYIGAMLLALLEILAIDAAINTPASPIVTSFAVSLFPILFLFITFGYLFLKWIFRGDVKWITDAVAASLK